MARRTHIIFEDDLDGGEADETVSFGLDGRAYQLDLSAKNAAKFRKELAQWITAGRRVTRRTAKTRRPSMPSATGDSQAIRAWATAAGYEVGGRGRIPAEVQAAYHAAH